MRAQQSLLPDGLRLHLQHGPIDIIAQAFGAADEVALSYEQAGRRFGTILHELVAELPRLRTPIGPAMPLFSGTVERRMADAVWPHRSFFITPMAAVAGAVAEEVLAAMMEGRALDKAYVNNGGDIALYLAGGESLTAGVVTNQDAPALDGRVVIDAAMPVRGIATSGWRGRSLSLGVADSVTVLAGTAAAADAAATLVGNATDVANEAVRVAPARSVRDDTDLGDRLVTVDVGELSDDAIQMALDGGAQQAELLRSRGLIVAAHIALQGAVRVVGSLDALKLEAS
ncbi:MAG: UPF0280 family protein [Alphaproteobacteria bacterium]|jgi:uncharacterized protein|nr:UPF0280 family protein [Alphaproteobacteria bacterium]